MLMKVVTPSALARMQGDQSNQKLPYKTPKWTEEAEGDYTEQTEEIQIQVNYPTFGGSKKSSVVESIQLSLDSNAADKLKTLQIVHQQHAAGQVANNIDSMKPQYHHKDA